MLRKLAALLLALVLLLSWTPALMEEASLPVMAGYEDQDSYRVWSNNLFFQRMEKLSGQSFQYLQYKGEEAWATAKAEMLKPDAQLPDVLFKSGLSPAETMQMLDGGVLIDLKPLLREHAPNLTKILEENPDSLQMITMPDGRIGALPYINLSSTQNSIWINQEWLKALKLDMPTTAEEFRATLEAFRLKDPNRNGSKDEMPLSFMGAYDLKYLAHAFGLIANDYNVFAKDGKVAFMPLESGFRAFIRYCRDLYKAGLIDKDGFSTADSLRRVTDAKATVRTGALFAPLPGNLLPTEWSSQYAVMPPLQHEGRQMYRSIAPRAVPGCFAITSACKDPASMLKWVDYLYSPEGAILAFAGVEGQDYLLDGDGSWRKTQSATQNSFLDEVTVATGTTPPGVSNDAFQRRYGDSVILKLTEEIDKTAAISTDPFPPYSLSYEQQARLDPMQRAIGRYVDESIARFVLGKWEATDDAFKRFEDELQALGVQEFLAFWQEVLRQTKEVDLAIP